MESNQPKHQGADFEDEDLEGDDLESEDLEGNCRKTNLHQKLLRLSSAVFLLSLIADI